MFSVQQITTGVVSGERADCFNMSAVVEQTSSMSTGRGSRRAAQLQSPRCETRPAFFDPTPAAPTWGARRSRGGRAEVGGRAWRRISAVGKVRIMFVPPSLVTLFLSPPLIVSLCFPNSPSASDTTNRLIQSSHPRPGFLSYLVFTKDLGSKVKAVTLCESPLEVWVEDHCPGHSAALPFCVLSWETKAQPENVRRFDLAKTRNW